MNRLYNELPGIKCYERLRLGSTWRLACFNTSMAERILIIDDDQQLALAYREYLDGLGYQVDCAHEIEEAETLLAHFPYSVVITDLRLSRLGFGGLDLVKHIRAQSLKTRIIVLTGYGWPELKAEASANEVDAFVHKPTRLSELARTIGSLSAGE